MITKKKHLIPVITVLVVLIAGYWYIVNLQHFPSIESAFIVPVNSDGFIAPVEEDGVLAPDGSYIYTSFHSRVNLSNGLISSNELAYQLDLEIARSFLSLSPNGHYLTGETGGDESHRYLLDMKEKSYQEESHLCQSWSRDSTRCLEVFHSSLVDMPSNKVIEEWSRNEDFTKIRNVSGSYVFLWDMDRHIPIAEVYPCLNKKGEETNVYCLVSLSYDEIGFSKYKDREHSTIVPILEVQPPREVVSWIFDPKGKYVLFAVWEHAGEYVSGYNDLDTITDSILILVNWRTKQSEEIFRISDIDNTHVAVGRGSSALQWSSDGSTIFISRSYAPAVVLKIKYP